MTDVHKDVALCVFPFWCSAKAIHVLWRQRSLKLFFALLNPLSSRIWQNSTILPSSVNSLLTRFSSWNSSPISPFMSVAFLENNYCIKGYMTTCALRQRLRATL